MILEYWYLVPAGLSIAVIAMSSGVSAGNFWVPVYLLWAEFDPPLAFWMTLATMLCGYASGVVRNLWQGTIDRHIIIHYLPFTLPATLVGAYFSPAINEAGLILLFGLFVLGYGLCLLGQVASEHPPTPATTLGDEAGVAPGAT